MDTRTQFMNEILGEMSNYLNSNDLELLRVTLLKRLNYVQVVPYTRLARISQNMDINERFFKLFVASRRLEGMSEKTITYYTYETKKLLVRLDKNLPDITTLDVQYYLSDYERTHNVCTRSLSHFTTAFFLASISNINNERKLKYHNRSWNKNTTASILR